MSMISELIEELIDNADLYTKELHDLMYRAADTIGMLSEKVRESKQEWIPCSERLPDDLTSVLVWTKGWDIGIAFFNRLDGDEWDFMKTSPAEGEVLAWMPLPKPWKGADNE